MLRYPFLPWGKEVDLHSAVWSNGFTLAEIAQIIQLGEAAPLRQGITGSELATGVSYEKARKSEVSWIEKDAQSEWLYERLALFARKINSDYFNFELSGFCEAFQYVVYKSDQQGHHDWHMDKLYHAQGAVQRKLSMVMQLSSPAEYDGGDLEIFTGGSEFTKCEKELGRIYFFPSWVLHRVTPVTRGTRRALAIWTHGPTFR